MIIIIIIIIIIDHETFVPKSFAQSPILVIYDTSHSTNIMIIKTIMKLIMKIIIMTLIMNVRMTEYL